MRGDRIEPIAILVRLGYRFLTPPTYLTGNSASLFAEDQGSWNYGEFVLEP
jgi:hypothetical protein